MRVRIARDELRRLRELTQTIKTLETEIAELVGRLAPQLVAEPGCGPPERKTTPVTTGTSERMPS
jgi:hypothetical protein